MKLEGKKILLMGCVWPEVTSSAAGVRSYELCRSFREAGADLIYASTASINSFAQLLVNSLQCKVAEVKLNDSSFDQWVKELQPHWVIYDRYILEEQFGWRVSQQCPQALQVIDLQDLHFIRKLRQKNISKSNSLMPDQLVDRHFEIDWTDKDTLRELAAIARADLSLVISAFEYQHLLSNGINSRSILYDPLSVSAQKFPVSRSKKDFVFVGNYRHAPNLDAAFVLVNEIWPKLSSALKASQLDHEPELHLYGAYTPKEIMALHRKQSNLKVFGPCEEIHQTLSPYRVLLAPLRFGAGIKGKILDSFASRVAVVTTSIGAEGIGENFPGERVDSCHEFILKACELYSNETLRNQTLDQASLLLEREFSSESNSLKRINFLLERESDLENYRKWNWLGALLKQESYRATEYFSRWLELKNKEQMK